ncbi:hypothetical protein [Methylibium sp.]|uniref:hypothetical protein n=1 Tax=Methylibium sp. TaxID=2067992 RepID=UPI003D145105
MTSHSLLAALAFAALLATREAAHAGDGHDHGGEAPAAAGQALPRFTAVSEAFELVGVLSGKQLTLYLDRTADNSPVRDAQIELEIAGTTFKAAQHGDDEYEVMLAEAPAPGVLPITATVTAGTEVDLLAGELDLHEPAHADESAHTHSWTEYAGWIAAGLAALALLGWAGRRAIGMRRGRAGAAA